MIEKEMPKAMIDASQALDRALLTGKRVALAALEPRDAATLATWSRDTGYVRLWDSRIAYPFPVVSVEKWIAGQIDNKAYLGFGIHLLGDGRLVGLAELDGIQWNNASAGVGIGIGDRNLWGQGLGNEAMQLLLDFAFNELGLRRLTLNYFSYNRRAAQLYDRLGFVHEGVQGGMLRRDGQDHDLVWMGLLRREWIGEQTGAVRLLPNALTSHENVPLDEGTGTPSDEPVDPEPPLFHGALPETHGLFVGQQVRLSALEKVDATQIVQWTQDGRTLRLLEEDSVRPWSVSRAETWIEETAEKGHYFAIRTPAQGLGPKRFLGWIALSQVEWDNRTGKVQMFLPDPADWMSGYAGEALYLLIRYAFHELNLRRLSLATLQSYTLQIQLCEEMGWNREVIQREAVVRDGKLLDLHRFGLDERTWESRLREIEDDSEVFS